MSSVMDAVRAVCSQYWDIFVDYFCVVFERMNQIVSKSKYGFLIERFVGLMDGWFVRTAGHESVGL